jgi:signal transduction histidine kinase
LQTLNKQNGDFEEADLQILTSIASYITIALENAKLYDDLKVLDKARERVINHLSHELKTPLAVISGVLSRIRNKLAEMNITELDKTVDRGSRNIRRLIDLQEKIDDILARDPEEVLAENSRIVDVIQNAADLIEEAKEDNPEVNDTFIDTILERLNAIVSPSQFKPEKIDTKQFLETLCEDTLSAIEFRQVMISGSFEKGCNIFMDRQVLGKVCDGLLRNAIENTPDQGLVEVANQRKQGAVEISFRDFGTGITLENQSQIFGGFFHTQDTDKYSSKKPYMFNAGGSGADLLRIKTFSERYGFSIAFESERCRFRPNDEDVCPGTIEGCQFVQSKEECRAAGGSTFKLEFPINPEKP